VRASTRQINKSVASSTSRSPCARTWPCSLSPGPATRDRCGWRRPLRTEPREYPGGRATRHPLVCDSPEVTGLVVEEKSWSVSSLRHRRQEQAARADLQPRQSLWSACPGISAVVLWGKDRPVAINGPRRLVHLMSGVAGRTMACTWKVPRMWPPGRIRRIPASSRGP